VADGETRIGGRYRLVRQLAVGGMGTVWEGWDERLRRPVAVKRLQLQAGLSPHDAEIATQRVMREARLTARLHHPNAVQVFDVVDDGTTPCLVMQYVASRSLQEIVATDGPLDPVAVARIGTQIAAALAAAHRAGIVHRDVKPGNVLIADDGSAKITDFGISHANDDVSLTSTGLVTGTPAYLAPEVARGGDSTFASDVYSLGATLYMAVEGNPPAGTETNPMAMLHRAASGQIAAPTRSGPLTGLLMAMLNRDPSERPSMVQIANALSEVQPETPESREPTRALPVAAAAAAPFGAAGPPPVSLADRNGDRDVWSPATTSQPPERRSRALWPVFLAAAIVVILGVVLAVVLLGNGGNGSPGTSAGGPTVGHTPTARSNPPSTHSSASQPVQPSHTKKTKESKPPKHTSSPPHGNQAGPPTAAQLKDALTNYYSVVPGNLDEGWSLLTPRFRHGGTVRSRDSYDSFWSGISSVSVSDVTADPPSTVSALVTYNEKNGHTSREHNTFTFVRGEDGVLRIDSQQ
jgi:eukaryotic-like serine/threonine-protein kinase